jgi:hypothetical protein
VSRAGLYLELAQEQYAWLKTQFAANPVLRALRLVRPVARTLKRACWNEGVLEEPGRQRDAAMIRLIKNQSKGG